MIVCIPDFVIFSVLSRYVFDCILKIHTQASKYEEWLLNGWLFIGNGKIWIQHDSYEKQMTTRVTITLIAVVDRWKDQTQSRLEDNLI